MITRWTGAAAVAATAVVVAVVAVVAGNWATGIPLALLLAIFAWSVSPLLAPSSPDWDTAQQRARSRGVPLILWKPGCAYCIRLRLALGTRGSQAVWMDISADEDAAGATRHVNQGNETTPTVITSTGPLTNPPPGLVRSMLTAP